MEIEAKFMVQDEEIFTRLAGTSSIASFQVGNLSESVFRDTYFDTLDMAVYSSGYSFRCREKPGKVTYTLKSLDNTGSAVHKREEIELSFSEKRSIKELGDGQLRQMLSRMTGSGKLFPLFEVVNRRREGMIHSDSREIAELCLDNVTIIYEDNKRAYLEVELELRKGTEEELGIMISAMKENFSLIPGSSSKFDKGMELLQEHINGLASGAGYMDVPARKVSGSFSLKEMFEEYDIERPHARRVAENSLELFDSLAPVHGLDPSLRTVMKMAALVHDVGFTTDMKDHHKEGRDILLSHPPAELPFPLHAILPWTTFLHKKKISGKKLDKLHTRKIFSELPAVMQEDILRIASILRIADGLDYSRMDSRIAGIELKDNEVIVKVQGPGARTDADRADEKSDLWRMLFKNNLRFLPASEIP